MDNEEHQNKLLRIEKLMDGDPSLDTPEGKELDALVTSVQEYEKGAVIMTESAQDRFIVVDEKLREALNLAREREKIWRQIIKEPLFHFLKHDPIGRTILSLFANGQISLGKCAEAITEKFCLGLEPNLPEWEGYSDEK